MLENFRIIENPRFWHAFYIKPNYLRKKVNNLSYQSMKKLMCLRNVFFIKCLSINCPNTKNNENKIKTEREKRNIKKTLISIKL